MKLKVKSNRRGVKLTGEASGAEELIYSEAECVKSGCDETLFTFSYAQRKKGYAFEYFVGTARPIREVLSAPIPREYFEPMLVSFLDLAQACDAKGLTCQRVSFEEEHIFFDPVRYSLRFAYMPVRGATERISSPLKALENLTLRARFHDEEAQQLADRVLDHVRRSPIFSWPEYEAFLREQGVLDKPEAEARDTSLLNGRATARIDCRDSYGFDFMSAQQVQAAAPKPAAHPACSTAARPHAVQKAAPPRAFKLVRLLDGAEWPLKQGINIIGSAADADVRLEGVEGVSRRHAEVLVASDACQITDLHSTNGVQVNGARLKPGVPRVISEDDAIRIARMQLMITG